MAMTEILCRLSMFGCLIISIYLTMLVWTQNDKGVRRMIQPLVDIKNSYLAESQTISQIKPKETCTEKHNLVFIKCMKCATETTATVIRRFGYTRNLSFVTPVKDKLYLGWPFLMTKYDYRPSSRGYNILMEHCIYNKTTMEALMPRDTVYITFIREPFKHLKSSLNYWKILDIAEVKGSDPMGEYVHNMEKYEAVYKSPAKHQVRYCIPDGFSMTKNLMSHCLGMPLGYPAGREDISRRQTVVQQYIDQLDQDFTLVMIVEYFHESLVLLKRNMCWTLYDILYKTINFKDYVYKDETSHLDLVSIHKNWSSVDYQLYNHFNKTFWKKISQEGPDFFQEVDEFRKIQANMTKFCDYGGIERLTVASSKWSPGFSMVREDCKIIWPDLLRRIQARHNLEEKVLLEKVDSVPHPKPQALC